MIFCLPMGTPMFKRIIFFILLISLSFLFCFPPFQTDTERNTFIKNTVVGNNSKVRANMKNVRWSPPVTKTGELFCPHSFIARNRSSANRYRIEQRLLANQRE